MGIVERILGVICVSGADTMGRWLGPSRDVGLEKGLKA